MYTTRNLPTIRSWSQIEEIANGRSSRWIANNTTLTVYDSTAEIRLHGNLIIRYTRNGDGSMKVDFMAGGFHSNTTKQRLHALLPVIVFQKDWSWYWMTKHGEAAQPFESVNTITI